MTLLYTTLPQKSIWKDIIYYNFLRGDRVRPLKEKISITIDSDLLELVRVEAENDDRSVSQFINLVLKKYIVEKRQREAPETKEKP